MASTLQEILQARRGGDPDASSTQTTSWAFGWLIAEAGMPVGYVTAILSAQFQTSALEGYMAAKESLARRDVLR